MIHSCLRSLIVVAGLAWAGCGVDAEPAASDPTTDLGSESADVLSPQVTQPPNHGCGYICHAPTADIYEVSWQFCLHACPGGPTSCTSGPFPPCP